MSHNVKERNLVSRKVDEVGGKRVEHLLVEQPGLSYKSLVCVEQEDGTMGRPVSADGGSVELLKPSELTQTFKGYPPQ